MSDNRGVRFNAEFKQEAVRLLLTTGKTATQLSRELGVSSWTLGKWKQEQLKAMGDLEIDGETRSAVEVEAENRQLRRELNIARSQCELLKKAIAICSQDGLPMGRPGGMR